MSPPLIALVTMFAIALAVLIIIFILVPVFKGVGYLIGAFFQAIGWFFAHIFEFIGGEIGDVLRLVGAIIAGILLVPMTLLNVVIGRWSAAGHFAESVKREFKIGSACLYRMFIRRPLKLVMLHGLLEGLEERVPEAMAGAPAADKPKRRTGQFEGYTIVGSLRGGGSGGKLYVAEPCDDFQRKGMPERVVIKSFALTEGSSLPQIVRESRALEAARQLGLVLDHGMEEHRFFYVMPFHDGDHLGVITRQLHGESDGRGLGRKQLASVMNYGRDLLHTLSTYHRGGLWHKDVKPENVIVHDGRAHLVDLGLVTPLRSAMTLTTHGTEYFRDPEMVRQALRGVKVHQVDGAKFDIYAAGAVMYFVLENTFPAHGGLSRFQKKSPEALRWIVKRAMTDYSQRYDSADEMLADLKVVMTADDPYAVKPAALPSMTGGAVAIEEPEDEVEAVFAAHTARPRAEAEKANETETVAEAVATPGPGVRPAGPARKPRLRVTSWWTGDYVVDDPGTGEAASGPNAGAEHRDFRAQARAFRAEAEDMRRKVHAGVMGARTAAKEQVKAARARAHDMRRKARQRRYSHKASEKPSPFLAFIVLTVLVGGAILGASLMRSNRSGIAVNFPVLKVPSRDAIAAKGKRPALLVADIPDRYDEHWERSLEDIIKSHSRSYNVVVESAEVEKTYRGLMRDWYRDGQGSKADRKLEELMQDDHLYAIIYVDKDKSGKLSSNVVNSTHPNAAGRRRETTTSAHIVAQAPALPDARPETSGVSHAWTDRPILLVNDHPAKADPGVEKAIDEIVKTYESRGWNIVTDDDDEVVIRKELPIGPFEPETFSYEMLYAAMKDLELGGVLHVIAGPGEGEPHERIFHELIPADPAAESGAPKAGAGMSGDGWEAGAAASSGRK